MIALLSAFHEAADLVGGGRQVNAEAVMRKQNRHMSGRCQGLHRALWQTTSAC